MTEGREIWTSLAFVQITTASISFIASLAVAVSIWRAGGLSNGPHTRIIFSISVADILQSFALIIGPFVPPESVPEAYWSIGNQATCSTSGLIFGVGGLSFGMHIAFLCFYYLCKIKYKMTNEVFSAKFERKVHAFIIIIALIINLAGLGLGAINTAAIGGRFCTFAAFPTGCRQNAELYGECTEPRTTHALLILNISFFISLCYLIGMIVCMVSILWHAIVRDRIFRPVTSPSFRPSINTQQDSPQQEEQEQEGECPTSDDVEVLLRRYVREITTQLLMYTGAYLLCVLPGVISIFSMVLSQSPVNEFLIATFLPLNGLFTILIYTRLPIRHLRRSHPEYSWLDSFILVLKAGGANNASTEIPEQIQIDPSSNLPFGVQSRRYAAVSSAVEYAGSEKDESSDCSRSVLFKSDLADRHTESGEHCEIKKRSSCSAPDEELPSKTDRTSHDILARAIARTRKMGKE
jgi:hypothetical protein